MTTERLNRYLARAGVASRRGADDLIAAGRVRVNGRRVPPNGMEIDTARDEVTADGQPVVPVSRHRYLALNKPLGVVVSAQDPEGRRTVFELLPPELQPGTAGNRLFTVGRLDMDSSGLLLLTSDGELSNRLLHPRWKVPKEYRAHVVGQPPERDLRRLRRGITLDDGPTQPCQVDLLAFAGGVTEVRVVLTEGRNRQVRRMFDAIGHPVRSLRRVRVGPIQLGHLREGHVRALRPDEIAALRRLTGMDGRPSGARSGPGGPGKRA
ncbi:MAG: rRNA pseudouridine synthase [Candidatus Dormibacteraeota bacterium]|nr:rRNA pseudouridine synthase [Candidatus Dormibacteraeota bacterium]